jgi:aminoglycoside phosphotransferase (APT) family kinase protein
MAPIMQALYPSWAERYDGRIDAEVVALGERLVPKLESYYAAAAGVTGSVIHGDYRLDNLLFGTTAGGPPVAVVDWQTHLWGDPLSDVSYFLGAGLVADDRRAHERDLVEAYRSAMASAGVTLSADECWRRYRLHAISGWHMAVFAAMVVVQTDRGDEMFCTMANRHGRQMLDLESESLLSSPS